MRGYAFPSNVITTQFLFSGQAGYAMKLEEWSRAVMTNREVFSSPMHEFLNISIEKYSTVLNGFLMPWLF